MSDALKPHLTPVADPPCNGCGHAKRQHIYEEGACRPGFVCPCPEYRVRIDPFKVRRRSDPPKPAADVVIDVQSAGRMHTLLLSSYRESKKASELAYEAYKHAERAHVRAYAALDTLESHMVELYEKLGWRDRTEFVTLEDDSEPEGEGA